MQKIMKRINNFSTIIVFLFIFSAVQSQDFNATKYYERCLRYEARGNFEIAEESCLNAIELSNTEFPEANLALARIYLKMHKPSKSEQFLKLAPSADSNAEIAILSAQIALARGNENQAESYLSKAKVLLESNANNEQKAQLNFLSAQIAESKGKFREAIDFYKDAVEKDALNKSYNLKLGELLYRVGRIDEAKNLLSSYQKLSNNTKDPDVLSLLARLFWVKGDLKTAAEKLEAAVSWRGSNNNSQQTKDLATLALIYYGSFNTKAGTAALKEASRYDSPFFNILLNKLLWLVLLIAILSLHLWGESKIVSKTTLEYVQTPEPWTMQNFYSILFLSVIGAFVAMGVFSFFRYHNILAILTPIQMVDTKAVFYIVFTLISLSLMLLRIQKNGWDASEVFLTPNTNYQEGFLWGLLALGITIAYLMFIPEYLNFEGFYLNFAQITPLLLGAAVLLPLTEFFFRAFAFPAMEKRYSARLAVILTALVSALVLTNPLILVLVLGLLLSFSFSKSKNALTPTIALLVLHLGIIACLAFIPSLRHFFI